MIETNTPYDDAYRTMLQECKGLLIPLINEIFGTRYTSDAEVSLEENEVYLRGKDSSEMRITDSAILIRVEGEMRHYHLECQSTTDGSMLIRMYEYDSQLALRHSEYDNYNLTVKFPESAILFLRHNKNTPDTMKVTIETPGGKVSYEVSVVKIKNFGLDEIFDKKLLFLIPFHIFAYEDMFAQMEQDSHMLAELMEKYDEIGKKINMMASTGEIDTFTAVTILEISRQVVGSLAKKYESVRKGVGEIMGGKVLEYEAKTIYYKGKEEGRLEGKAEGRVEGKAEGRAEGREEGIRRLVECLKELGQSESVIVSKLVEKFKMTEEEAKKYI